jgi:GTP 3',8-cyclase
MPEDTLGRPLRDLRISVTDRCTFRCAYCMPREVYDDHEYLARSEILTYDEIARFTLVAVSLGVTKVRLTGGEPLLRRELPVLVRKLSATSGIEDIALTTNGHLLSAQAVDLRDAGLHRVTVSLDAIDPAVNKRMTDTDVGPEVVLEAIDAAERAGLVPIKVNTVVRRGWNDDQVIPLVNHFRNTPHTIRFIEFMDVGTTNQWAATEVVPSAELVELIGARWPLEPVDRAHPSEVASTYRFIDGAGSIGFISSVSQPFCADCSRLRLSAEGSMYTCLFAHDGVDVKGPLRAGVTDRELHDLITRTWSRRADRYSEVRGGVPLPTPRIEMSYIGG